MNNFKKIYNKIKKYNTIVIARHIGPDPDALGSTLALRDTILNTFPKKNVYAIGNPASKFKYIGILDKFDESMYDDALLIVLDTPDKGRVDGVEPDRFNYKIKIDHHPFVEEFCDIELIDDKASSSCQLIIELILNTKLKLTKEVAEKLYIGLVSDTNRFLFNYTSSKTFSLISKLIEKTKIDFTSLYEAMYVRSLKEIKFEGFLINNLTVTDNGLAYIVITENMLKEHDIDASTARNMINNFYYIEEMLVWAFFSEDKINDIVKGSIRSRGPIINDVVGKYNGGGHIYASGVRFKTLDEIDDLINDLDNTCKEYLNKNVDN